jgi:hypothetical protein
MRLKYRLQRLERSIGRGPCPGPVVEIVDVYEDQEPPPVPLCPCGVDHTDRIRQIMVMRPRPAAAEDSR